MDLLKYKPINLAKQDINFKFPANGNIFSALNKYIKLFQTENDDKKINKIVNSDAGKMIAMLSFYFSRHFIGTYFRDNDLNEIYQECAKLINSAQLKTQDWIIDHNAQVTNLIHDMDRDILKKQLFHENDAKEIMEIPIEAFHKSTLKVFHNIEETSQIHFVTKENNQKFIRIALSVRLYSSSLKETSFIKDGMLLYYNNITKIYEPTIFGSDFPAALSACKEIAKSLSPKWSNPFLAVIIGNYAPSHYNKKTLKVADMYFKDKNPELYKEIKDVLITKSLLASSKKKELSEQKRLNSIYAKAFSDKKTNTKKAQQIAQNSNFAKIFKHVEIDGATTANDKIDYNKFEQINQLFPEVYKLLPSAKNKPALRFRRLGHYNATGLYFPTYNCIAIDIRNTNSFIHEYGHYCDYQIFNRASLSPDFLKFVSLYINELKQTRAFNSRELNYFGLPSEVFARCFEIFVTNENDNPALSAFTEDNYLAKIEYGPIIKHYDEVKEMMSSLK